VFYPAVNKIFTSHRFLLGESRPTAVFSLFVVFWLFCQWKKDNKKTAVFGFR